MAALGVLCLWVAGLILVPAKILELSLSKTHAAVNVHPFCSGRAKEGDFFKFLQFKAAGKNKNSSQIPTGHQHHCGKHLHGPCHGGLGNKRRAITTLSVLRKKTKTSLWGVEHGPSSVRAGCQGRVWASPFKDQPRTAETCKRQNCFTHQQSPSCEHPLPYFFEKRDEMQFHS